MVRTEGLEPSQPYGQGILSPISTVCRRLSLCVGRALTLATRAFPVYLRLSSFVTSRGILCPRCVPKPKGLVDESLY